ncbi:hypothetical protein E4U42_005481 [Claviceps africana]|uniref:Uncharacterized protein n=1 Tax=Claviceps africana TaxID=83212 RepID=A0A8K0JC63_9HYPO|nr:hypothetical protein E4U42_005481 [Claviceps africana]
MDTLSTSDTYSGSQHITAGQESDGKLNAYHNDLIDPLMMMSGTRNSSTAAETQPYFGVSQHILPTIFGSAYDHIDNEQIMNNTNGNMGWPVSRNMPSNMNVMMQVSDIQNTDLAHSEEDAVISGLWEDNFGRIEPSLDGNGSQSEWLLPFGNS